uniref:60S acidic ribosomal protein P2 n=1 Tax=Corethron hystrix TaxID=216773 RepID=A0A6U5EXA4_9STRA|mmetsp:Transcript_20403/g.46327  ORF Transcript_20403/g.46327 Transcript_20403/m.46327 type:complete len:116 (+) Transcript_20403:357-704(+)|eukprot:CAMPEP_0113310834 /NCGR_PEP_ID=MMETSP0010_2-20120614/8322_1 /TAXON_ID=216773 ORGANISM="Corethron hystrix, Strain 308" /NCGR_SAMPLE_ID=MMETSP0010_2 /ASSEMBLY_ACC=CAM_ASM_000155 /LENGTH=115 /DNA_ID=CAMNT_0000166371 /DNA_START=171 /DNA_END=518 /DNA_ORIENTATION=- /assembly_acc=CAM_ASM_000155
MRVAAAYMLLKIAGKEGSSDEITAVIQAGGGSVDDTELSTFCADIAGKDVDELLSSGMEKLKNVSIGGGGEGGGGGAGGAAAEEEKEEEPEEEEEADMGGGMDMFGGDDGDGGDY